MAQASPVLRRMTEDMTLRNSPPPTPPIKMSGVRLDDGTYSLRTCNNRVTRTRMSALRTSQLLTLAIDRFGAHMAIVGA